MICDSDKLNYNEIIMNNTLFFLIGVSVVIGLLLALIFLVKKLLDSQAKKDDVDLEKLVDQVFGRSVEKIAKQSKQVLESDKEAIKVDLENKHKQLEKLVSQLEDELKRRDQDLKLTEKERSQQFGELKKAIEEQRQVSEKLATSTQELKKVLASNQQRGAWGERIIENILQSSGLQEGKQWIRQGRLGQTNLRPDITLLLPHDRVVPVDVKFPFASLQKMTNETSREAKKQYQLQFARDVKTKIAKVAEYISPESGTLDYAIMFVPNEAVFAYINQEFPDLVDLAISKRVLMVSPISFIIVARTVMESYRNFMVADNLREVLKHIEAFTAEWVKFKTGFDKYGNAITSLQKSYETLAGTRMRQMERRIDKVKEVGGGALLNEGEKE